MSVGWSSSSHAHIKTFLNLYLYMHWYNVACHVHVIVILRRLDQCKKSTGNVLNVYWKSPGNLLGWICRHPVLANELIYPFYTFLYCVNAAVFLSALWNKNTTYSMNYWKTTENSISLHKLNWHWIWNWKKLTCRVWYNVACSLPRMAVFPFSK